jgi:hypothetical protein
MDLNIDIYEALHHGHIFVCAPTNCMTMIRLCEPSADHVYLDLANDAKAHSMQVEKIIAECGLPTPYTVFAYDHEIMFVGISICLRRIATRQPSCKRVNISLIGHGSDDGSYCLNNDRVSFDEILRRLHELAHHYGITITVIFATCFGHLANLYPIFGRSALEIVYFTTDDNPKTVQNHNVHRQADTVHVVDSTNGPLLEFYRGRYSTWGRQIEKLISSMKFLTIHD